MQFCLCEVLRVGQFIETGSEQVVARGCAEEGALVLNESRQRFRPARWKALEMVGGSG